MADISKVAIDTVPLPESPTSARVVQVRVPAKVAFDLRSMQKVTKTVLERLGHPNCHSGWDIRIELENRFLVDEKLNVREML